jgi:hypothetical protein
MQIFEVFELEKYPFMETREIVQGEIIADVLNENNFDKVYLLVDHDTKRIWKYYGPKSSEKMRNLRNTLAGMLRHQLRLFYKIYSLNEYSRDDLVFQEIIQKPIKGGRANPIDKRNFSKKKPKILLNTEKVYKSFKVDNGQESKSPDGGDDDFGYITPFPRIPPDPPDGTSSAKRKIQLSDLEKKIEIEPYCKYCGATLVKGASICHVCGNKVY